MIVLAVFQIQIFAFFDKSSLLCITYFDMKINYEQINF